MYLEEVNLLSEAVRYHGKGFTFTHELTKQGNPHFWT